MDQCLVISTQINYKPFVHRSVFSDTKSNWLQSTCSWIRYDTTSQLDTMIIQDQSREPKNFFYVVLYWILLNISVVSWNPHFQRILLFHDCFFSANQPSKYQNKNTIDEIDYWHWSTSFCSGCGMLPLTRTTSMRGVVSKFHVNFIVVWLFDRSLFQLATKAFIFTTNWFHWNLQI